MENVQAFYPSVVNHKFAYFQKASNAIQRGAARRAWWFHVQGLQRSRIALEAFPTGEPGSAQGRVALLANGTTIPCAARLALGASGLAESMRTYDSRH